MSSPNRDLIICAGLIGAPVGFLVAMLIQWLLLRK